MLAFSWITLCSSLRWTTEFPSNYPIPSKPVTHANGGDLVWCAGFVCQHNQLTPRLSEVRDEWMRAATPHLTTEWVCGRLHGCHPSVSPFTDEEENKAKKYSSNLFTREPSQSFWILLTGRPILALRRKKKKIAFLQAHYTHKNVICPFFSYFNLAGRWWWKILASLKGLEGLSSTSPPRNPLTSHVDVLNTHCPQLQPEICQRMTRISSSHVQLHLTTTQFFSVFNP